MPRPWPLALVLLASAAALVVSPGQSRAAKAAPLAAPVVTAPAPGPSGGDPGQPLAAATPAAVRQGDLSSEIQALLSDDTQRQWAALDTLRKHPDAARAAIVQALQRTPPLPGRWRLILRLEEFGTQDDVPLLLKLRDNAQSPMEKRIAEGAARALYSPVGDASQLEGVVQDFSFIQTKPPAPVMDRDRGKWLLSDWSFGEYNRGKVPLAVIKALLPLRGKVYDTQDDLAGAIRNRLSPAQWKAQRDRLMNSADTVPGRVQLEGLTRVRLQNPLKRPLLLRLSLNAWFGRFREPPGDVWVYLDGGASRTVDIPVTPQGLADDSQMRIDLRVNEIDDGFVPDLHKLYLPLQP